MNTIFTMYLIQCSILGILPPGGRYEFIQHERVHLKLGWTRKFIKSPYIINLILIPGKLFVNNKSLRYEFNKMEIICDFVVNFLIKDWKKMILNQNPTTGALIKDQI